MKTISISEIAKKPSVLDNLDDVVQIVNKKTNEVKGFFISAQDLPYIKDMLEELEFQKWYQRNRGLETSPKDLEDLFDETIEQLGKKLS